MSTTQKLEWVKKKVIYVLDKYEYTRDDDTDLMLKIWELFYKIVPKTNTMMKGSFYVIECDLFRRLPNKDDIKRIRARLNQEWRYISSDPDVRKKRKISEEKYQQFLHYRK